MSLAGSINDILDNDIPAAFDRFGRMLDVAEAAGVSPRRVSFRRSLMLMRVFCLVEAWGCAPGNLPKRIASHHEAMSSLLVLPECRPERRYKRQVKIKMNSTKRNPGKLVDKGSK